MRPKVLIFTAVFITIIAFTGCDLFSSKTVKVRYPVDTVGFAHKGEQMDSIINRIYRLQGDTMRAVLGKAGLSSDSRWKLVISPHDDYTYVGYLYPAALANLKADTVFVFGVAHHADDFGVSDRLVFGSFTHWLGPYDSVAVPPVRDELIQHLPSGQYTVNDSIMKTEYSVEALLPFLQYYNRDVTIVPILVPAMKFNDMKKTARLLAGAIKQVAGERKWQWGQDYAIAISNDAVHYGDKGWGGKDFARFGTDSAGYHKAVAHEHKIIRESLLPALDTQKIEQFTEYTVQAANYKKYKWTWCGRYSVPLGLLTGYYLQPSQPLSGTLVDYNTSLKNTHLPVKDLGMGTTASVNQNHWVGYVVVGYK